jgi:TolB-like protein/class 3 adenylate cyclase/Flp pilus assembly protein TadD
VADAERRLAAILSGDVAGYSRLMSADEEATVRTLAAYRQQVEALVGQHRGRLVDFTGDEFLAEFPSALNGAECAVEIQRVLAARNAAFAEERRVAFRLGLHTGDVRVEGERLFGEGINLAARLQALAEPGGLCISRTVHEQVSSRLDVGFDDLGEREVKNFPEPVRVFQARLDGAPQQAPSPAPSRRLRRVLLGAGGILLVAVLALWLSWPRPLGLVLDLAGVSGLPVNPALPDKPSLAVLPFTNMSGDAEQEYFSDGISEDLITDLSKIPELFVIARHSAFAYKGRNVDLRRVGRELGVRWVLEGSVRRADDRVRITAQLIDAENGFHLWSERYDRELADVFAVQTEISREILKALRVEIRDARFEAMMGRRRPDLRAYDALLRGASHLQKFRRADLEPARRFFRQAVEIDPEYPEAVAFLGLTYFFEYAQAWSLDPALLGRARELADRALALDPDTAPAVALRSGVHLFRGEAAEGMTWALRAVELAPNLDPPHMYLAMAHAAEGRPLAALEAVQTALRINPGGHPAILTLLGVMNRRVGRSKEAVAFWEQARAANPDLVTARLGLAMLYEEAGRHEEARAVVQEVLRINPDLGAEQALGTGASAFTGTPSGSVELLRRAGLP